MSYLRALPRSTEAGPARAVTVVSSQARDVVYLDQAASIEIITEALKAWGLRVRAQRDEPAANVPAQAPAPLENHWQTTRPENKAPGRLNNALSPLWLPIRAADPAEPAPELGWFTRAA